MEISNFSRTLWNEAKLGFYETDSSHAMRLGRLIRLEGECNVLEPSCGTAAAVSAFLKAVQKPEGAEVHTYGVELNGDHVPAAKERLGRVLNADFLSRVDISPGFGLVFSNPPYGTMTGRSDRYETQFALSIYRCMVPGGLLVYIVPAACLGNLQFRRAIAARYSLAGIYRFDPAEYAKYHQFALFLYRKERQELESGEVDRLSAVFDALEDIPCIPDGGTEYAVPVTTDRQVKNFRTQYFDENVLLPAISGSPLFRRFRKKMDQSAYSATKVGRPPVPLTKDFVYRLAMAGVGQGVAGSALDGTVHLQRGVCKTETTFTEERDDDGRLVSKKETIHTKFSMNIVEPSGKLTELV